MGPLAIAGLASAIPAGINTGFGIYQAIRGNKMLKGLTNPDMPIPQGAIGAENVAKNLAMQTQLPGQHLIENKLGNITGNAVMDAKRVSDNPNDAMDATMKAYAMQMDKTNDLGVQAASFQNQNQGTLLNQENVMSNWQNKKWENDELNPYLRKASTASALLGSGIQNISGGLNKMSDVGANLALSKYYGSLLDKPPVA